MERARRHSSEHFLASRESRIQMLHYTLITSITTRIDFLALQFFRSDEKCVSPLETSYVSLCTKSGEWTCSTTDDETKQHDHIELANIIAFNITRSFY